MKKENNIEELHIEFGDTEAGWMNINFIYMDKKYQERMSHCFDPLPEMKTWLENIANGAEQTSFAYDDEGTIVKFDFEYRTYLRIIDSGHPVLASRDPIEIFTISYPYFGNKRYEDDRDKEELLLKEQQNMAEKVKIVFRIEVERKKLIHAFYMGLINFFQSKEYRPLEWEFHSTHDKLGKKLNLDYNQLIEYCEKLNKTELINLLNEVNANDAVWWLEEDFDNFDNESPNEKRTIIVDLFDTNANPYDGTSMQKFRSEKIEKYLNF